MIQTDLQLFAKEGMITKGVTFNVLDEKQQELFDFAAKHKNFSAYVKWLIHEDMLRKQLSNSE